MSPFAFSRPIYVLHGPVIHYSCRLDLMVFVLYLLPTSFWFVLLGWASFLSFGFHKKKTLNNRQADLKSPYGHVVEIPINLISVPVRICFQGLPLPHGHGQQGVQRPRNPAASSKTSPERPSKLLKGVDRAFSQAVKPSHRHRP